MAIGCPAERQLGLELMGDSNLQENFALRNITEAMLS